MLSLRSQLASRSTGTDTLVLGIYADAYGNLFSDGHSFSLRWLLDYLSRKGFGGLTATTHQAGSNPCAKNVLEQLDKDRGFTIGRRDWGFGFTHPGRGQVIKKHIQGVARLRDWNGLGRMVLSDNFTDKGLHLAFQEIKGADEGIYSQQRTFRHSKPFDVRKVPKYGKHDHPGGMQAQGDIVAIAMEDSKADHKHAAVYFLKVTGDRIEFLNHFFLDDKLDVERKKEKSHAATVGFVRLNTLHYLVAVAGKNHGKKGIWFYESDRPEITEATQWRHLNIYKPARIGYGKPQDDKYAGAGGGLNLVTDCSGAIYLLAMHGTAENYLQEEHDFLQVFSVTRDASGKIHLQKQLQHRDSLGAQAHNNISFRWSGGVYVSKTGQLALLSTERRFKEEDIDLVNGAVHLGKLP